MFYLKKNFKRVFLKRYLFDLRRFKKNYSTNRSEILTCYSTYQ